MHIVSFELNTEIEYAEDRHHGDKKSSLFCFRENHPADLMEQWTTTQCVTGMRSHG